MTFFPWENGEAKPSCRKLPRPCGAMRLDMWMCNERLLWNLEIVHVTMESINEVMIGFFVPWNIWRNLQEKNIWELCLSMKMYLENIFDISFLYFLHNMHPVLHSLGQPIMFTSPSLRPITMAPIRPGGPTRSVAGGFDSPLLDRSRRDK